MALPPDHLARHIDHVVDMLDLTALAPPLRQGRVELLAEQATTLGPATVQGHRVITDITTAASCLASGNIKGVLAVHRGQTHAGASPQISERGSRQPG